MEKLFKELSEFARQNRKALKDAEQWLNNFNGTFVRAWRCAITNWEWQKVVVVAKFAFDKGPEFLSNTILSGEYSGECHPSLDLIHNALDEGEKKPIASKNHSNDLLKEKQSAIKGKDYWHNKDFTSVVWYGTEYQFNKTQARCIKHLWENDSASEKSIGIMLDSAACNGYRLRDTFRSRAGCHCAWGKMIISAGKGCFKLNKPQS